MSGTILVVDDNYINLKLAYEVLSAEGYQVLKATDAEEALKILEGELPALILMDIALPGIDGLTLTKQLKQAERTKHIIIVAVTASAMKGDREKSIQAGCDDYISKPVDTRSLVQKVGELLKPKKH